MSVLERKKWVSWKCPCWIKAWIRCLGKIVDLTLNIPKSKGFYIQSFHNWICCPRGDPCLCVCLCVCLSVRAFYLNTIGPISMKLGPHDLNKNLRWDFSQILEMLPQWRHNGFFDVLRWGTLTPSIFVQFSSNWHMLLFISWLCMGLQSSVFGSYLLSEMTVGKTVKN